MTTVCRKIEYGSLEFSNAAKFRFHVCCEELGWFALSNYPDKQETDEYDQFAEHFCVYDGEQLVGYCRLISGVAVLPTLKHSHGIILQVPDNTCEVSRLIVDKRYRKNSVAVTLINRIYETVLELNMDYTISLIEPSLLRFLNHLGIPFKQVGQMVKNILGADVLMPCMVKVSEIQISGEVLR